MNLHVIFRFSHVVNNEIDENEQGISMHFVKVTSLTPFLLE